MPKAVLVKRGDEYLPDVQLSELEEMYRCEHPGKSRDWLQVSYSESRVEHLRIYPMI